MKVAYRLWSGAGRNAISINQTGLASTQILTLYYRLINQRESIREEKGQVAKSHSGLPVQTEAKRLKWALTFP